MNIPTPMPHYVWHLFERLRRRGFQLGVEDYSALREAMRAGFGWTSRSALRDLCASLWAKSQRERDLLETLFDDLAPDEDDWQLDAGPSSSPFVEARRGTLEPDPLDSRLRSVDTTQSAIMSELGAGLPPLDLSGLAVASKPLVLIPQFPLTYREVAQAWRRLRRPVRKGPPTELDIEGTIVERSRRGVATPVVLRPRRRNMVRLLLLVDRLGSMAPFHQYCDEVVSQVLHSGRLDEVQVRYFHDVPSDAAEQPALSALAGDMFPSVDAMLGELVASYAGTVYADVQLLQPELILQVLDKHALGAAVAVITDAGAARGHYDLERIIDTLSFARAVRAFAASCVWLNPLPRRYWRNTTAWEIQRHVPMFPLDPDGLHTAIDVLRGHPYSLERPL